MYDAQEDYKILYEDNMMNSVSGSSILSNDYNSNFLSLTTFGTFVLQYGTLTLNADGTYTYQLDETNSAVHNLNNGDIIGDVFTYTVYNSSDGSYSQANIIFSIGGMTDPNLFSGNNDTVNFNNIYSWQYQAGNQYDAGAGNDTITLASDQAHANAAGFDPTHLFNAGEGNDRIITGGLQDRVNGGAGSDVFVVKRNLIADNPDLLNGGSGDDFIANKLDLSQITLAANESLTIATYNANAFGTVVATVDVRINGKSEVLATDIYEINGSNGNDLFLVGNSINVLNGGLGDDVFKVLEKDPENIYYLDSYNGGSGINTLDLSDLQSTSTKVFGDHYGLLWIDNIRSSRLENIQNVIGSASTDYFYDNADGANTFSGGNGNDTYFLSLESTGVDNFTGGNGIDTLNLSGSNASVNLIANSGSGSVFSGSTLRVNLLDNIENVNTDWGNDTITTNSAVNSISAGANNDTIKIGALNASGFDTLDGGDGTDTLDSSMLSNSVTVSLLNNNVLVDSITQATFSNIENVTTGSGNDTVITNSGINDIGTGAGNDIIKVGALTSSGYDVFNGGSDFDQLDLSALNNGFTVYLDYSGSLSTAAGTQALLYGIENVVGSSGNDTIITSSTLNNVSAGIGNDTIKIGAMNASGVDTLDGGADTDILDLSASTATGLNASLDQGKLFVGSNVQANLSNIENVTGSNQNDTITGNSQNNTLQGGNGNDTLNGGDGNDLLVGGTGDDALQGGNGDDTAQFSGNSWEYIWSKAADGTITVSNNDGWGSVGPDGTDTLKNIEHIQFADHTYNTSDLHLYPGWDYGWF